MASDKTLFPSVPQAALLLLAGFLLQYVLNAALYDFRDLLGITKQESGALVTLLSNGILISAVAHHLEVNHRNLLHPGTASPFLTFVLLVPPILLILPLTILLDMVLISALEWIFPLSIWEQQAFSDMVTTTLPAFIATCLIAPFVEEMLFRGILLRSFLERYPRGLAIGYSALFFGVAHMNIYQLLLAFLLGLVLGWLYERSRSLIPCIVFHAAVNSTVFILEISKGSDPDQDPFVASYFVWFSAVIAAIVGTVLLRRLLSPRKKATGAS